MAIVYKIDVLNALKEANYNTNRIRKEKLLGEACLQQLREKKYISMASLEKICKYLKLQPGDIIEYVPDEIAADDITTEEKK